MSIIDKKIRFTPAQSFIYSLWKDLRSISITARETNIDQRRLLDIMQADEPIETEGEFKRILAIWSRFYLENNFKKKDKDGACIDYGITGYACLGNSIKKAA